MSLHDSICVVIVVLVIVNCLGYKFTVGMYHMNIMSVLYTAQWAKSLSKWLNCSYSSWLFLFCVHDLVYGGGLNSPRQARTEEMVFIATLVAIVDVSRKKQWKHSGISEGSGWAWGGLSQRVVMAKSRNRLWTISIGSVVTSVAYLESCLIDLCWGPKIWEALHQGKPRDKHSVTIYPPCSMLCTGPDSIISRFFTNVITFSLNMGSYCFCAMSCATLKCHKA